MLKLFAGRTTPQKVFEETIYLIKPIKSSAFVGFFILLIMKEIQLTQGKVALVDDDMYEYLNQWKWYAYTSKKSKTFYAARNSLKINGVRKRIKMHIFIYDKNNPNILVDHINNNGLDNRKCNLRICTHKQNQQNKLIFKSNTSGYKGVFWHKLANKWASRIGLNRKMIYLGVYINKVEAAKAYNIAAIKFYGEFAKLNEI